MTHGADTLLFSGCWEVHLFCALATTTGSSWPKRTFLKSHTADGNGTTSHMDTSSATQVHGDDYFQIKAKMEIAKKMISRNDNKEAK